MTSLHHVIMFWYTPITLKNIIRSMATENDLPPPLPASPPPPGEDEEQAETGRGKFKALQKMLSSSKTMYSSPNTDFSMQAAPPPKKQHVSDAADEGSPKLTHVTRDRPKRKVRPPSQKGRRTSSKETNDSKLEDSVMEEMEHDTVPPDLPPPPPPSSVPPDLPPEPPPTIEENEELDQLPLSSTPLPIEPDVPVTSSTLPEIPLLSPLSNDLPILGEVISKMGPKHTPRNRTQRELQGSKSEAALHTREESTGMADEKKLSSMMDKSGGSPVESFSERLRKIRENRSGRNLSKNSPRSRTTSSLPKTSDALLDVSGLSKTTTEPKQSQDETTHKPISYDGSSFASSPPVTQSPSPLPKESQSTQVSLHTLPDTDLLSSQQEILAVKHQPTKTEQSISSQPATIQEDEDDVELESGDDFPPPPPIPDLPPPPEEIGESDETNSQSTKTYSSSGTKRAFKVSFRTQKKREEWTRKSAELDSVLSDPLPLLIGGNSNIAEENIKEHTFNDELRQTEDGQSFKSSSESLPSLPDSPPPVPPEGPPPTLPESLPPPDVPTSSSPKLATSLHFNEPVTDILPLSSSIDEQIKNELIPDHSESVHDESVSLDTQASPNLEPLLPHSNVPSSDNSSTLTNVLQPEMSSDVPPTDPSPSLPANPPLDTLPTPSRGPHPTSDMLPAPSSGPPLHTFSNPPDSPPLDTFSDPPDSPPLDTFSAPTDGPPLDTFSAPTDGPPLDTLPNGPPLDILQDPPDGPPMDTLPAPPDGSPLGMLPAPLNGSSLDLLPAPPDGPPLDTLPDPPDGPPLDTLLDPPDGLPMDTFPAPPDVPPLDTLPDPPDGPPLDTLLAPPDVPPLNTLPDPPDGPPLDTLPAPPDVPPPYLSTLPVSVTFEATGPQVNNSQQSPILTVTSNEKEPAGVQMRKARSKSNSPGYFQKRRSAFDALVSVEPSAEEKLEPKLSVGERRSLAMQASRRADADTTPVLKHWQVMTLAPGGDDIRASSTPNIADDSNNKLVVSGYDDDEMRASASSSALMGTKWNDGNYSLDQVRLRSSSVVSDLTRPRKKETVEINVRQSLPPESEIFQKVKVVSQGNPPSSPDLKFTPVSRRKWSSKKKSPKKANDSDMLPSSSMGDLPSEISRLHTSEPISNINSFKSSSESLDTSLQAKKLPKNIQRPLVTSPLAMTQVAQTEPPVSPTSVSSIEVEMTTALTAAEPHTPLDQISYAKKLQVHSVDKIVINRQSPGLLHSVLTDLPAALDNTAACGSNSPEVSGNSVKIRQKESLQKKLAAIQKRPVSEHLSRVQHLRQQSGVESPARPRSVVLDSDILKTDPARWTIDEVCQWLEVMGLGSFRQSFRDKNVDGAMLLQMDTQLFAELGVDSPEIREIFLAKIYELSNPSSNTGGMEDDFLLTVDTYDSDDWKKLQAAVDALKSPVLDDTIELDPSAIGQFLFTHYVRSRSTPNITRVHLEDGGGSYPANGESPYQQQIERRRRGSEDINLSRDIHNNGGEFWVSNGVTSEWLASLPPTGRGRERSMTAPPMPSTYLINSSPRKGSTLPANAALPMSMGSNSSVESEDSTTHEPDVPVDQLSPEATNLKPDVQEKDESVTTAPSPSPAPVTTQTVSPAKTPKPRQGLVKLYMDKIQKGALYKSFLVDVNTTAEQLVVQALDKANMSDRNPILYCIWEAAAIPNVSSSVVSSSQPILKQRSHWPQRNSHRFELRLKKRVSRPTSPATTSSPSLNTSSPERGTTSSSPRREPTLSPSPSGSDFDNYYATLLARIESLEKDKSVLQVQLDSLSLQQRDQDEMENKITALSQENTSLRNEVQSQQLANNNVVHALQQQIDELTLANRKLEDMVVVLNSAGSSPDKFDETESRMVLEKIQTQYTDEVSNLTYDLREKEKALQEMRSRKSSMDEEMVSLQKKSKELQQVSRLLSEHSQQIKSLEKDLSYKEETIQHLRVQLEEAQVSSDQALAFQKTLQAAELTSKQQQELSNKTVKELREQLSRMTKEASQREQIALSLRNERDRLKREQQTKDALVASLEADLASYRSINDPKASNNTRIQNLQRSLSVHEVTLASLRSEFQRQSAELKTVEEEVYKIRKALAQKEEHLSLISSTQEQHQRPSLYSLVSDESPQLLISAMVEAPSIAPANKEEDVPEKLGIRVTSIPGEDGYVITNVSEAVSKAGVKPGDRLLEINGNEVSSKSQREVMSLLRDNHKGAMKIVITRPLGSDSGGFNGPSSTGNLVPSETAAQKLISSLTSQLDFQTSEVDHWRQDCDRLKAELYKYSSSQKEKDSEIKHLQAAVQDLKQQLKDSEESHSLLRQTSKESGKSAGHHDNQKSMESLVVSLKEKDKEIEKLKGAEKSRIAELKKLQRDKEKAVEMLQQHMTTTPSNETLDTSQEEFITDLTTLAKLPRSNLITKIQKLEESFTRHRAYLDQLLTVVIDQNPELLSLVGQEQTTRDETDNNGWC